MMDEDDGKPAPKRSASNVKSNGAADRGVFGPGAADMERVSSMENMEVMEGEMDTKVYCTCRNVSYGEMIGCDDDDCEIEWVSKVLAGDSLGRPTSPCFVPIIWGGIATDLAI